MSRALFAVLVACFVCAMAATPSAQRKAPGKGAPAAAAVIVNLNTASPVQIAALPGVGEKAAQRIVDYREKNGGFKKIEELMNVKGIGEKSFLKLKPLITIGDSKAASK